METHNKCPHCGAARIGINYWCCGSDPFFQSDRCKERAAHAATKRELEEYRKENDVLRALLPKLGVPCVYCGLTEIGKCERGFPGCAQADDLMVGDEAMHGDVLKRLRSSEARVRELEAERSNRGPKDEHSYYRRLLDASCENAALQARVQELEGLKIAELTEALKQTSHQIWPSGLHADDCTGCRLDRAFDVMLKTLGEAMARKDK